VATLVFPSIGIWFDYRKRRLVHPAWWWAVGSMVAMQLAIAAIAHSTLGTNIYRAATAGSPGEHLGPLAFPAPPGSGRVTDVPTD
jgi:hypothetical protein